MFGRKKQKKENTPKEEAQELAAKYKGKRYMCYFNVGDNYSFVLEVLEELYKIGWDLITVSEYYDTTFYFKKIKKVTE